MNRFRFPSYFHLAFAGVHLLAMVNGIVVLCHLGAVAHHGKRVRPPRR